MVRLIYTGLLWLALPLVLARLAWRARRQPVYLSHMEERFGCAPAVPKGRVIWLHCVSVGETRAAVPLVERLRATYPDATFLVTHMTPTGRDTGRALFGKTIVQAWLPWDYPFAVRRFLSRTRPMIGILLETEIWPNLLFECHVLRVPVFLVNARLSESSAAGYGRVAALSKEALSNLSGIAAQTEEDATRFHQLGAKATTVTGNIKFDLVVPEEVQCKGRNLRHLFGAQRRIWVIGSTREGEEVLLLDAIEAARPPADVLIVFVPRHPQRFDSVESLMTSRGLRPSRRSIGEPVSPEARYVIGDSMGEMLAYYDAADVVFVGGSLKQFGGQNLIEACAMGRPVIFGPHTFNFASAAEGALAFGAGLRAADAQQATAFALELLADNERRSRMGRSAAAFAAANRGAVERTVAWLKRSLEVSLDRGRG